MKYYTKKWYSMLHACYHLDLFKIVRDEQFSEEIINRLYEKELKKRIEAERGFAESTDHYLDVFKECDFVKPKDYDEKAAQGKAGLINGCYPEWVKKEADPRLLALGFMPRSIYKKLKAQEKENRKAFQLVDDRARKETKLQWGRLPAGIRAIFRMGSWPVLEEACLLSLDRRGSDISCIFRYGEWQKPPGSITPYVRITFENADFIENEVKVSFVPGQAGNGDVISDCMYVRDELYLTDDGFYEYHLMVSGMVSGLSYMTVLCKNIVCQQNVTV